MSSFSPSDAALEGFRLTREQPLAILAWSGVYALGIVAMAAVMSIGLGPNFITFLRTNSLQPGDVEAVKQFGAMLVGAWPAFLVALLIAIFILAVLTAGIYRIVLRPQERGFAHLRIGADEVRLAVTHLLLACIGIGTFVTTEIIIALALQALGGERMLPALQNLGGALLLAVLAFAPMAWVGVRLSLATPLAFYEKRISLPTAWRLTRGKFWPLFAMILLSLLFYVMIWALFTIISYVMVSLAGGQAAMAAPTRSVAAFVALLAATAIQLLLYILQAVMSYAPFAVAYRQLRDS